MSVLDRFYPRRSSSASKPKIARWKIFASAFLVLSISVTSNLEGFQNQGGIIENTVGIQKAEAIAPLLGVPIAYWLLAAGGTYVSADLAQLALGGNTMTGWIMEQGVARAINAFLAVIGQVEYWFLNTSATVGNWLMNRSFEVPERVQDIWTPLRDFVNVVAALVLVIVALMIVVGVKKDTYSLKKYLPSFIAGLVLVNLSYIIALFAVDVVQVATKAVAGIFHVDKLDVLGSFGNIPAFLAADSNAIAGGPLNFMVGLIIIIVFMYLLVVPLVQMAFAFALMLVGTWLLIAVSPLAFIGYFIPELKAKIWDKWWNYFLTLITMPMKVLFIMGLVFMVSSTFVGNAYDNFVTDVKAQLPTQKQQEGFVATLEQNTLYFLPFSQSDIGGKVNAGERFANLLVFVLTLIGMRIAIKQAMSNELTSMALEWGEKVGGFVKRQMGRTANLAVMLPWQAGKAIKKNVWDKPRARKAFGVKAGDSAAKAAASLRSAQGFERKAGGVQDAIAKKRRLGTLTRDQEQRLTSKMTGFRQQAQDAREGHVTSLADEEYYKHLRKGTLSTGSDIKGEMKFVDSQIKANEAALARGDTKDAMGRDRSQTLTMLKNRAGQLKGFQAEHKKTGVGMGGELGDMALDTAKGAVSDYFNTGVGLDAAKKIIMNRMSNPAEDINALQSDFKRQNNKLRNRWKSFEQMTP